MMREGANGENMRTRVISFSQATTKTFTATSREPEHGWPFPGNYREHMHTGGGNCCTDWPTQDYRYDTFTAHATAVFIALFILGCARLRPPCPLESTNTTEILWKSNSIQWKCNSLDWCTIAKMLCCYAETIAVCCNMLLGPALGLLAIVFSNRQANAGCLAYLKNTVGYTYSTHTRANSFRGLVWFYRMCASLAPRVANSCSATQHVCSGAVSLVEPVLRTSDAWWLLYRTEPSTALF